MNQQQVVLTLFTNTEGKTGPGETWRKDRFLFSSQGFLFFFFYLCIKKVLIVSFLGPAYLVPVTYRWKDLDDDE